MEPKKAPKKSEEIAKRSSPNGDVISDTTSHAIDSIKSWRQIFEILDYEIKIFPHDVDNKLRDIAESKLHKIAVRPQLTTYNDMISWALERTNVKMRRIMDSWWVIISSFRPEYVQVMYKLCPSPKYVYNQDFLSNFQRKECFEAGQTYPHIIKEWWWNEEKFRADTHGVYTMASSNEYMIYVAMMLCILFGKKIPTHFPT